MAVPVRELGYVAGGSSWFGDGEPTPELRWPLSIDVYDRMRSQDAQVGSVLRAVTLPVRRTNWWIERGDARPEVARQIAEDLGLQVHGDPTTRPGRLRDRFSWSEHLRLALLMLPYGHSVFEQVYRPVGGSLRLRKLAWRPPQTILKFDVAADGGLNGIQQYHPGAGDPVTIPVDRLVVYVNELEGSRWTGRSLLRTAYKNWLLKDRLLRVQTGTIERNGMGIPIYEGAEGEEDLKTGLAMARSYRSGESAGAATPYGAKLRLAGVEGTIPDADPAIRYHDEQIARAVLAHFLNLGTQTGSWALGSTFADFFTLSLQTLAQQIADVATQHIVEDLVDANFGPDEPAPRVAFEEIGSRQAATAQALKLLTDAGIIHPDKPLEEALRQTHGLPAADPATREVMPAPVAPPEAPQAPSDQQEGPQNA
jgi:hypothetical protein